MTKTKEKVSLSPFDAAEYLGDEISQAAALSEALATGHRGVILDVLNAIARARGMTALAKETGIKREVLYAALRSNGNPTLETLLTVIGALGLHLSAVAIKPANDSHDDNRELMHA